MTYNEGKSHARMEAIRWQEVASRKAMSYGEIAEAGEYFNNLGKRYGLLREFRENGIPC